MTTGRSPLHKHDAYATTQDVAKLKEQLFRFLQSRGGGSVPIPSVEKWTFAPVQTSEHAASPFEFVPCDLSGGSFLIALPEAPPDQAMVAVQIVAVGAGNALYVYAEGSDSVSVSGTTSIVLNGLNAGAVLIYDAGAAIWYLLGTEATSSGSGTGPFVSEISPNLSALAGGGTITISGNGFTGATAVTFGSTPAASFSVVSSSEITAVAPALSAGFYDITVTTPAGVSGLVTEDAIYYEDTPTVTGIAPPTGLTLGGGAVQITGTNLYGATAVAFGGTAALDFDVVSPTEILAYAPAGSAGTVDITVITPIGTSATSSDDHYAYETPSGTGGPFSSVVAKSADYTFISGDNGNVFVFSGAYLGASLLASPPAEPWQITIKNENLSPLYVLANGNTLGTVAYTTPLANSVVLYKNESMDVWSTGTAYEYRLTHTKRPVVPVGSPKWYWTGFNTQQDFGFFPQSMTAASEDGVSWFTVENPSMINNQTPTPFFMRDHQPIINPVDGSFWVFFDELRNTGTAANPSYDYSVGMQIGLGLSLDGGKTWTQQASIDLTSVFSTLSITGNTDVITSTQVWDGTTWWQKLVLGGTGGPKFLAFPVLFGTSPSSCALDTTSGHYLVDGVAGASVPSSLHLRDPGAGQWLDYFAGEASTSGVSERYTMVAGAGPFTARTLDTGHPIVQTTDSPYVPTIVNPNTGSPNPQGWDGSFVFYVGGGTWRAYLATIGEYLHSTGWFLCYVETQNFTGSSTRWGTPTECTLDGGTFFCDSLGMRPYGLVGSHYYDAQMAENLAALVTGSNNSGGVNPLLTRAIFGGCR